MLSKPEILACMASVLIPFSPAIRASAAATGEKGPNHACAAVKNAEDFATTAGETGHCGGQLVISRRSEPKTLNPLTAADGYSRGVIGLMMADLVHINRQNYRTEAALAKS